MSALAHLINPPAPVLRPGRVVWCGRNNAPRCERMLSPEQREATILEFLQKSPGQQFRCLQVAKAIDIQDAGYVRKVLLRLIDRGLVKAEGGYGSWKYSIVEPA